MFSAIPHMNLKFKFRNGRMAELVDAPVLGTGFERSEGSSPFSPTRNDENKDVLKKSVYDVVYDLICCIRLRKEEVVIVKEFLTSSSLRNYYHFFFYAHVMITIGNTHVFLNNQPMHLCGSPVYNRI